MLPTILRRWSWCYFYRYMRPYGFFYGTLISCLALCSRVFQSCLSFWSSRLGTRELVCVLLVHLFIFHVLISVLFLFLLVSGVGCGLWLWRSPDVSINFLVTVLNQCHFRVKPILFMSPTPKKLRGAYWFGPVSPFVRLSIRYDLHRPRTVRDRILKFDLCNKHEK